MFLDVSWETMGGTFKEALLQKKKTFTTPKHQSLELQRPIQMLHGIAIFADPL